MAVVLLPFDLSGDLNDLARQTRMFVECVWREAALATPIQ